MSLPEEGSSGQVTSAVVNTTAVAQQVRPAPLRTGLPTRPLMWKNSLQVLIL